MWDYPMWDYNFNTPKVFSMLDTRSLCYAQATCSMFKKCAMEPLCNSNIDLTSVVPKVDDAVVSAMIRRAGKDLQSLKLGILSSPTAFLGSSQPVVCSSRNSANPSGYSWNGKTRHWKESCLLTRSCLISLCANGATAGALLRRLHLYNIDRMDSAALRAALSACLSLLDLEMVGLHVKLRQMLESVNINCHFIERLSIESSRTERDYSLRSPTCVDLVKFCPHLTSLALRGFKLHDHVAHILVKGFRKLKLVDFSTFFSMTGTFLRNLGSGSNGRPLEVLILRDCMHLKEVEVARFLAAVLEGDFKFLRHLVGHIQQRKSSWRGRFVSKKPQPNVMNPCGIIKRVLDERPDICLLAEFPEQECFIKITNSDIDSDQFVIAAKYTLYELIRR